MTIYKPKIRVIDLEKEREFIFRKPKSPEQKLREFQERKEIIQKEKMQTQRNRILQEYKQKRNRFTGIKKMLRF